MSKKVQSIYAYFNEFPKEMVDEVIESLSEEEIKLLNARYGGDLNNPKEPTNFKKEDSPKFYGSLVPKIKRRLKDLKDLREGKLSSRRRKLLENRTNKVSKEVTAEVQSIESKSLQTEEQQVQIPQVPILQTPQEIPQAPIEQEQIIPEIINQKEENNLNTKEGLKEMLEILTKPSFTILLEALTPKEAIVFCLRLGTSGKAFKAKDIAEFLETDIQDIYDTTNRALDAFQENVDMLLEKEQQRVQGLKLSIESHKK